jgi:alpha-galactosidase
MMTKKTPPIKFLKVPDVKVFIKILTLFLFLITIGIVPGCKSDSGYDAGAPGFHKWAPYPPMGWNSWDCFGPTVVEDEVKANADYMAKNLKKSGWEYIVVDIRWFVENDKSGGYNQTDPRYVLDEYGRFMPATNRFPSAADGKGFRPLADYVHKLGLKFGIHIMRGVPVIAVKNNTPILGTDLRAGDIYSPENQCTWLRDMFTVVKGKPGAQEYYNSIFRLYASWGVDFVKVDDLSGRLDEIELVRNAIDSCGRKIVLSLSPSGNRTENADFLRTHANMWRTTDDFWDNWTDLKNEFEVCNRWTEFRGKGYYPDADMLPLGRIGIRAERGEPRNSLYTRDEQFTLMTLFSIFRSPLMFGGNLPDNDEFTLSLITNKDVLYVNRYSANNRQIFRENDLIAWTADDPKNGDKFVALFDAQDQDMIDESKALWQSDNITQATPGQSVDIDLDITGAEKLVLVATFDESERFMSHNVDWIDPVIIASGKKIRLTNLEWTRATSARGVPSVNKTMRGGKLTVDGKEYANGINAGATSVIEYKLPEGALRFQAKAGLDNGIFTGGFPGAPVPAPQSSQANPPRQRPASAKFLVFTQDPEGAVPADTVEITVKFDQLGISGTHSLKDLWTDRNLGTFTDGFTQKVTRHGARLFRIH